MKDIKATNHFILQRITSVILIPLSVWFCLTLASMVSMNYLELINFLKSGLNFFLLFSFILIMAYHLWLGMEIIIEDYISAIDKRNRILWLVKFIIISFTAIAILLLLTINFTNI